MGLLRTAIYNLVFWLATAALAVAFLPLLLVPGWRTMMGAGTLWSRAMIGLLEPLVGLRYEVRGRENLPSGPALFAAKHQSAWDTLAMPVLLPSPVVVLKRELFWVPFYGWFARRAGMIAIDRKGGAKALRRMLAQARAAAAAGRPLAIFPQGTRTAPGAKAPYQPGVAALYGELGLPVVPVALNSGLFWGRRAFRKRPGVIVVEFLPPIPPGLPKRKFLEELEQRIETATDRLEAAASHT